MNETSTHAMADSNTAGIICSPPAQGVGRRLFNSYKLFREPKLNVLLRKPLPDGKKSPVIGLGRRNRVPHHSKHRIPFGGAGGSACDRDCFTLLYTRRMHLSLLERATLRAMAKFRLLAWKMAAGNRCQFRNRLGTRKK